jgi:small subunit ribosomal protein S17
MTQTATKKQATRVGVVAGDKRDKTRKLIVSFLAKHPKYGKYVRKQTALHAHDEANESRTGDRVEVEACRPLSKTKRWRIVRVVERAGVES